ncbi:MAG TPA: 30S ribosomal protein S1 [Candidatus Azoamicus sp. OHIO1]
MVDKKFEDLYEEILENSKIYPGALITGEVIDINNRFVIVSAFLKADGYIPINQFKSEDGKLEVSVGSKVEVVIDYLEDIYGDVRLSREKAKKIRAWEELEKVYKSNEVIVGSVTAKVKGGFTVKIDSIKAFLPGSLVSFKSVFDPEDIKGKELKFKIIKLEKKKNNIVVSQKFIIEERNNKNLKGLLEKLNEGDTVIGIVKNITDYGVFIDLGGLDGLLHITDMSWKRVKHPSNLVKIGDEINVKILKFDKDKSRVSLGLKQLSDDPWTNVKNRYKKGDHINGRVTNITDYGCFVEIEDGIEGLVHLSEMDWTNKNVNPNKLVKQDMEVKVSILDINEEKRRISLGLKQCTNNPWDCFAKDYKVGDKVSGKIKSITDFGIFLELDGGIDGLVHLSDITWENSNDNVLREYKKGEFIDAVILGIDVERERISLGIKQLTDDPFLNYITENQKGSLVDCSFVKKLEKGIVVKLADKVEGFLKLSDGSKSEKADFLSLDLNDVIKAKIVNVDKKNRNIILVAKGKTTQDKKESVSKVDFKGTKSIKPTLGDLLRKQI